jgi:hypothetical protein
MPDQLPTADPRSVWKNQTQEKFEMNMQQFLNRRAQELSSKTRSDIIASVAAVSFFLAVIVWRFSLATEPLQQLVIGFIVAWVLVSLYWFRDRFRSAPPRADAPAATGLDYYRTALERRRDHLKNAWIWYGPILLASAFFIVTIAGKVWPSARLLRNMLPFTILLAVWIVFGAQIRRRQRREIQREIDEIDLLGK